MIYKETWKCKDAEYSAEARCHGLHNAWLTAVFLQPCFPNFRIQRRFSLFEDISRILVILVASSSNHFYHLIDLCCSLDVLHVSLHLHDIHEVLSWTAYFGLLSLFWKVNVGLWTHLAAYITCRHLNARATLYETCQLSLSQLRTSYATSDHLNGVLRKSLQSGISALQLLRFLRQNFNTARTPAAMLSLQSSVTADHLAAILYRLLSRNLSVGTCPLRFDSKKSRVILINSDPHMAASCVDTKP